MGSNGIMTVSTVVGGSEASVSTSWALTLVLVDESGLTNV
jgi:hypothetical protein